MVEFIAAMIVATPLIILIGVPTVLILRWKKRRSISPKKGLMDI